MKASTVLALAALLAVVPAASATPWLHGGHDPARTGTIPFEGPATNDTAFRVQLPGTPVGEVVIVGGVAYVSTADAGFGVTLTDRALWAIDLATANVTRLMTFPDGSGPELVRPGLVILEQGDDLFAVDVESGNELWRTMVVPEDADIDDRDYSDAALLGDTLFLGFRATEWAETAGGPGRLLRTLDGVMALDVTTGDERWHWTRPAGPAVMGEHDGLFVDPREPDEPFERAMGGMALSFDESRVYVYMVTEDSWYHNGIVSDMVAYERDRRVYELWTVDRDDGSTAWMRNDTEQGRDNVYVDGTRYNVDELPWTGWSCCAYPLVKPSSAYIRLDAFEALNKGDGETIWESPTGRTDQIERHGSMGMGSRGNTIIAASPQTLYRLDAVTGGLDWQRNDPTPDKKYGNQPIIVDPDTIYVSTTRNLCGFGAPGVEARSLATGELLWDWHYQPSVGLEGCTTTTTSEFAYAPGVFVWGHKDGTVSVVGRTEASLGAPTADPDHYPDVGEGVTFDLSGTEPGVFGPATRYRVFWGDGTTTGWTDEPVLTHVYQEVGNFTARLQVANDANQTASTSVRLHVGSEAPAEPNWVSRRFEPDNQDMTFGVLGILIATTGGAIGVAQKYRHRSRLQDELDALERLFEETRGRPIECEAQLTERKAHARGLLTDGHLNEEQFRVIEGRADDLKRELRIDTVEQEFGFLPYALVVKAREMLEDGRVTSLESEAFLAALEQDEMLTDPQRTRVRERIEDWFGRDAGGGQ